MPNGTLNVTSSIRPNPSQLNGKAPSVDRVRGKSCGTFVNADGETVLLGNGIELGSSYSIREIDWAEMKKPSTVMSPVRAKSSPPSLSMIRDPSSMSI